MGESCRCDDARKLGESWYCNWCGYELKSLNLSHVAKDAAVGRIAAIETLLKVVMEHTGAKIEELELVERRDSDGSFFWSVRRRQSQ